MECAKMLKNRERKVVREGMEEFVRDDRFVQIAKRTVCVLQERSGLVWVDVV